MIRRLKQTLFRTKFRLWIFSNIIERNLVLVLPRNFCTHRQTGSNWSLGTVRPATKIVNLIADCFTQRSRFKHRQTRSKPDQRAKQFVNEISFQLFLTFLTIIIIMIISTFVTQRRKKKRKKESLHKHSWGGGGFCPNRQQRTHSPSYRAAREAVRMWETERERERGVH